MSDQADRYQLLMAKLDTIDRKLDTLLNRRNKSPEQTDAVTEECIVGILHTFSDLAGKRYLARHVDGSKTVAAQMIQQLLKKGYTEEQIRWVIGDQATKLRGNPEKWKYYRPKTIFRLSNFEEYLAEVEGNGD